jgi:hypothetical protein
LTIDRRYFATGLRPADPFFDVRQTRKRFLKSGIAVKLPGRIDEGNSADSAEHHSVREYFRTFVREQDTESIAMQMKANRKATPNRGRRGLRKKRGKAIDHRS